MTRSCRYEPDLNATYREIAEHYGAVIIPARVGKPKDKAKVESGVLRVEQMVLAPLRHRTFFSLTELNEAIRDQLKILNNRPFQKLDASRQILFETLDRPALKPLPVHSYVYADWKKATLNIDYHLEVDHHYLRAPYALIHQVLDVRFTDTLIQIFCKGRRVASHRRSYHRGGYTTVPEHMPKAHQKYLEWTPSPSHPMGRDHRPSDSETARLHPGNRPHPEQGYRSCLGVLRLKDRYSSERLEAACARALAVKAYSYKNVESILKNGLDRQPLGRSSSQTRLPLLEHENLRGKQYYQ